MAPKKVAIVGGGCTGLAAFWALKYSGHEVHIFEATSRLGGITHLVQYEKRGKQIGVDTGLVYFKPSISLCSRALSFVSGAYLERQQIYTHFCSLKSKQIKSLRQKQTQLCKKLFPEVQ
ncbi:LOW QUALITY PROTEIN: hypothetical protein ACJ72_01976 [Emergomyces africanus]|uniref:Amine oxidase domain-containing protein n=1 Tax=Emergomyces africanus TaxID=1955775 RepID=A0A1B7P3S4_9EURO|nr:LOW QUALITY PROTEIN: hypothetical protein ACJ72_01976 [Emergomyces africanus]